MKFVFAIGLIFGMLQGVVYAQQYPYPLSSLQDKDDALVNDMLKSADEDWTTPKGDSTIQWLKGIASSAAIGERERAVALAVIANIYCSKNGHDEAFPFHKKALPLVSDLPPSDIVYSVVHGGYGMYMANFEGFNEALPHLKAAIPGLALRNENGSFKENGLYEEIIKSYYAIGMPDSALVYQQRMVSVARRIGSANTVSQAYNDAAIYFTQAGDYKNALHYFQEGLHVLDTTHQDGLFNYVNLLESRAHPLIKTGQFEQAIADLKYVYQVRKRLGRYKHAMQSLAYLIQYYLDQNQPADALRYWQSEKAYFNTDKEINGRSAPIYLAVGNLYQALGDAEAAAPFVNIYNQFLLDKLREKGTLERDRKNLNSYVAYRNAAYEQQLQLEKLETERLEQNLRKNRWLMVLLALLLVLFAVMVYSSHKLREMKREKKRELELKNAETLRLKNQNLEYKLLLKEKDLKRIAADNKIRTSQKKQFLKQLKKLDEFAENNLKKELEKLVHNIEHTIDSQNQLSTIQDNIENINASFEEQLRQEITGISAQEIKLCSLMKIGMSNQDIARVLNRENSTIRSYKFRLKNKAGLDSVKELEEKVMSM